MVQVLLGLGDQTNQIVTTIILVLHFVISNRIKKSVDESLISLNQVVQEDQVLDPANLRGQIQVRRTNQIVTTIIPATLFVRSNLIRKNADEGLISPGQGCPNHISSHSNPLNHNHHTPVNQVGQDQYPLNTQDNR